jgi:hypothetical protein
LTATGDTIGEGQPTRRPNQGESARSRQGQSTTRANNATPNQLLTENQGPRAARRIDRMHRQRRRAASHIWADRACPILGDRNRAIGSGPQVWSAGCRCCGPGRHARVPERMKSGGAARRSCRLGIADRPASGRCLLGRGGHAPASRLSSTGSCAQKRRTSLPLERASSRSRS